MKFDLFLAIVFAGVLIGCASFEKFCVAGSGYGVKGEACAYPRHKHADGVPVQGATNGAASQTSTNH